MGDFPGGPVVKNPPSNAGDEDPVQFKEKWWEKKIKMHQRATMWGLSLLAGALGKASERWSI